MIAINDIKVFSEINDGNGNRLSLRFIEIPRNEPIAIPGLQYPDKRFYDFHSLVWDFDDGSKWIRKATIKKSALESEGTSRWVSDIYSLNPQNGSAIIRVAEGDWSIIYSWREWDLVHNNQIRMIRVCDSPFDRFDDSDSAE